MTERRATTSYFMPIGTAALVTFAALVMAAVRSHDPTDTFVVSHAALASPEYHDAGPITPGTTIDPTEKRFFAVNTHRIEGGTGTVIGWRWFSNGGLGTDHDETYRKLSIYVPGDLPATAEINLDDPAAVTAVYTQGGSASPQEACWGRLQVGTLHVEHDGDRVKVRVKGMVGLSGRTTSNTACEPESLDLKFTAKPLQLAELTPWLGAPGTRPNDETYRKVKP